MKRAVVVLALLVLALGVWERALSAGAAKTRAGRSRVGGLLTKEEREGLPIAALRVELGGEHWLYGRVKGMWRCLDYREAPASPAAIQAVVDGLTKAEGVVYTADVAQSEEYGINVASTVRVALCGPHVLDDPNGDVLIAFDVGARIPGRDGCFVRRRGTKEIWGIDSDPRTPLETRAAPGLPPLLEPGVVPSSWPGWKTGLQQVFVDLVDGTGYGLERQLLEIDPSELGPGKTPWVWMLDTGGDERRAAEGPATAFSLFLRRVPYADVLDRERRTELVLDPPHQTITLASSEGDPLQLFVGPPLPSGGAPVWVPFSATLYLVPDAIVPLLAPEIARFAEGSEENPWDGYLR